MMTRLPSQLFHHLAIFTLGIGVLLIWWGAAVTTEDVGLAVPDWPLCYGKINPEGWWKVPALLLEHGHRWIASAVGLLVLAQYLWQWASHRGPWIEVIGIVLCSAGYLYLVYSHALFVAAVIAVMGTAWVVLSWWTRKWPMIRGLTVLSGIVVVLQASIGGLRVLKMSDPYGILHGCLGQLFFCLLLLIALVSSRNWHIRMRLVSSGHNTAMLPASGGLFFAVFIQLVFGAILRHTQRDHLAASDVIMTGGNLFPGTGHADLFMLFLHKYWGFGVAVFAVIVACMARSWLRAEARHWRAVPVWLTAMPVAQVALGIWVILTGKSFWVTNFHVLNGLGLLAVSFSLAAGIWSGLGVAAVTDHRNPAASEAGKSASLI